jgi:KAP-like P-loop domain-containing protein
MGDPDPLDLTSVAMGLSRFLRNKKTTPPLTIAVTGRWGSGKSSLMNILRTDLQRSGFPTVWFNAWHNQKEADLLSSLLETIRLQAVPPLRTLRGLTFRLRLVLHRSRRRWPAVFALLVVFSLSLGYFQAHPDRWGRALDGVSGFLSGAKVDPGSALVDLIKTPGDMLNAVFSLLDYLIAETTPNVPTTKGVLGLLLGSGGGILLAANKWIRAFATTASRSSSREGRGGDSAQRTGARQNFADEFRDVTESLKPRKLLVLVDDLDRCRPQNVAEVLEAINFLVSAGDCYVVMGMEREMVTHCVGLAYADVAKQMEDEGAQRMEGGPNVPPKPMPLWVFASQYLEKLINIEVPVPEPSADQSEKMMAPTRKESERIERVERAERHIELARKSAPWVLAAAALIGSYLLGYLGLQPRETESAVTSSAPAAPPGSRTAGGVTAPSPSPGVNRPAPEKQKNVVTFIPGRSPRGRVSLVWVSIAGIGIVIVGISRLSLQPETFVKDSDQFEAALRAWHPLVVAKRNTPRSIKRFVNKVRYFAMALRTQEPRRTRVARALSFLGLGRPSAAAKASAAVSPLENHEDLLVALSALQYVYKDEFGEEGTHDWFRAVEAAISADERLGQELKRDITKLMNGSAADLRDARAPFDRLATGIRFAGETVKSARPPGSIGDSGSDLRGTAHA